MNPKTQMATKNIAAPIPVANSKYGYYNIIKHINSCKYLKVNIFWYSLFYTKKEHDINCIIEMFMEIIEVVTIAIITGKN